MPARLRGVCVCLLALISTPTTIPPPSNPPSPNPPHPKKRRRFTQEKAACATDSSHLLRTCCLYIHVQMLRPQLKQQLRGTLVDAQWRGDTSLTLPLFWRRSTASSDFRVGASRSSLHSLASFPPGPVPNKHLCFCGR